MFYQKNTGKWYGEMVRASYGILLDFDTYCKGHPDFRTFEPPAR